MGGRRNLLRLNRLPSVCRVCPIFQISNVSGENMDLLKMFLNLLSPRTTFNSDQPAEFQIDDTYSVPVRKPTSPPVRRRDAGKRGLTGWPGRSS